ncbi:MAG: hypothetical protein IPK83_07840 [Planctomycetes bacterium]|nr:hypothetical protein [Planctomycetota bacterium]
MKLEMEHGPTINNPDGLQIEQAIMALPAAEAGFAVLSETESTYFQVTGCQDEGFKVEYQAGSTDAHFRAGNEANKIEDVIRAMQLYAKGDAAWKSMFEWQPYDLTAEKMGGCRGSAVLVLSVLIASGAAIASMN